jgi:hypothetical protein
VTGPGIRGRIDKRDRFERFEPDALSRVACFNG